MALLHLEIVTMERKIFDDYVTMVIAPGIDGVLGILPRHTSLLTALTYGELQVKKEGEEDHFFAIGGGFMEVQPDHVIILADAAEHAEEIDLSRAEGARRRAEELLARAPERTEDFARAEAALRRSTLRLKVGTRRRRTRSGGPGGGPQQ